MNKIIITREEKIDCSGDFYKGCEVGEVYRIDGKLCEIIEKYHYFDNYEDYGTDAVRVKYYVIERN